MFIDFRGGQRNRFEKDPWFTSRAHSDRGSNSQPRYVPQPRIEPATFWGREGDRTGPDGMGPDGMGHGHTLQPTWPPGQGP